MVTPITDKSVVMICNTYAYISVITTHTLKCNYFSKTNELIRNLNVQLCYFVSFVPTIIFCSVSQEYCKHLTIIKHQLVEELWKKPYSLRWSNFSLVIVEINVSLRRYDIKSFLYNRVFIFLNLFRSNSHKIFTVLKRKNIREFKRHSMLHVQPLRFRHHEFKITLPLIAIFRYKTSRISTNLAHFTKHSYPTWIKLNFSLHVPFFRYELSRISTKRSTSRIMLTLRDTGYLTCHS